MRSTPDNPSRIRNGKMPAIGPIRKAKFRGAKAVGKRKEKERKKGDARTRKSKL